MNNYETPLVSVIIPVYKVEAYLDRCVQSVVDQTYKNLEIILVDDGSPDNCPAMCDAWAQKDERIRVIHQENGGSASARNAGLSIAHGVWIGFVDADDVVSVDMYESLLESAKKANGDIAFCNIQFIDEKLFQEDTEHTMYGTDNQTEVLILSQEEALVAHLDSAASVQINNSVCDKLFRSSLFAKLDHLFINVMYEDAEMVFRLLCLPVTVSKSATGVYYYIQYSHSKLHTFTNKTFDSFYVSKKSITYLPATASKLAGLVHKRTVYNGFYMLWWSDHAAHGKFDPERKKLAKELTAYINENRLWRNLSKVQKEKYILLHFGLPVYDFVWNKYHEK